MIEIFGIIILALILTAFVVDSYKTWKQFSLYEEYIKKLQEENDRLREIQQELNREF